LIIFPLLIDPSTCLEINNHKLINGCFNWNHLSSDSKKSYHTRIPYGF
jgi:hypothetical protein